MRKAKKGKDIIQVSVTMDRELKQLYARLAVELDLSFSQLVRYALRRVAEAATSTQCN
jgi:antitoxin component of RelBE/YafQ-DinJ toxin-antitoxin module